MSKRKGSLEADSDSSSDSDSEFKKLIKRKKTFSEKSKDGRSSELDSGSQERIGGQDDENISDVEEGEVLQSDSDMGEFDDGLDENLMGDDEDRSRLAQMTEMAREEEIFKRAEKRETLKKRYEIEKKLKLQKKSNRVNSEAKGQDTKERSRARKEAVDNKKDKKSIAMDVLKAKRKEKQEQQQILENKKKEEEAEEAKKKWKANEIFSSDSSDDEVERARSPEKRERSSSSSSSSVSSRSRSPPVAERIVNTVKGKEDLEKIRLDRKKLEQWCHLPFFEKLVTGCFVRTVYTESTRENRRIYRINEIVGVEEGKKIYQIGNTRTNKILRLRHAQKESQIRFDFASNEKFQDSEFDSWREETMLSGMCLHNLQEIEEKYKAIMEAEDKRLNEKDIQHMVKEKERFQENPRNYAMFKSRLVKERDAAMADGRHGEASKINERLAEIEERAEDLDRRRCEKISSIALINDRNRKNNILKAEANIKQEMAKKRLEGETSDPFTRRKTKPMLATAAIRKAVESRVDKQETADKKVDELKPAGKQGPEEKKENEPAKDLFSAHDFDIDIKLDSMTPNNALKPNLIPVNKIKKDVAPKRSLNLSEYKKKRGLI